MANKKKKNNIIKKNILIFSNGIIEKRTFTINYDNPKTIDQYNQKIEKLRKNKIYYFDLQGINKEELAKIEKAPKKITKKDIDVLLNLIMSLLSGGEQISELKNVALNMEKEIKINYILVYLLKQGIDVIDILKNVNFDNKEEIIEILENKQLKTESIREKIENIMVFNRKIKAAQNVLKGQFISMAAYYIIIIGIVFGVKYGIFGLMKEKLGKYGLDLTAALALPNKFMNIFINIVILLTVLIVLLILLRLISKS